MTKCCLRRCQETNSKCNEDVDDSWVPSRLIFVGSADGLFQPKLVLTRDLYSNTPIQYLALSHRWGTSSFLTLDSGNEERFRKHIPLRELRQTFQDAIKIAQELRVPYVWIDSLCIIQGSEQDWRAESKTMHLVYRNAFCTLAAAEAGKLEDGFIDIAKPVVKTEFLLLLELQGKVEEFMVIYDSARFLQSRIPKWPLMNRGWVLQESLLSRRTMYFGTPLIWECREGLSSSRQGYHVEYQYPLVPQRKIWPNLLVGQENVHGYWRRAVRQYSRCALTKPDDKPVAMSGIARTIKSGMQSEYFAGLWREYIAEDLLWTVGEVADGPPTVATRHVANYRGMYVL